MAVGSTVIDVSQANNTSVPIHTKCWEREGLAVEIQPTNTNAAVQALLTGRVEFVLSGPAAAIIARSKGGPIKAVYMNMRKNFVFLVVPEASPIKDLKDFKGKTVGVFSYGAQQYRVFKGMMTEVGLDPEKDVSWIETGAGAQAVAALRAGRVEAWGTWDSQLATAENMGLKFRRFTSEAAEKLNWGSSIFTRDDYAAANPEVVGKFLRCVAEGTAFTIANPEAAVKAHWTVFPATKPSNLSDAEALRQALHIVETRIEFLKVEPGAKWGEMPPSSAAETINFMKSTGELKDDVKPSDMFTNAFVPAINAFDQAEVEKTARASQ
ncbi:ABC transporter substrate-binding protein [Enterovirga aerilata]|uniref:ABC transporter substrate-binding protein n=1 Tax=Enterovirga aerilata TaxID=2730920 RepID=A0A849I2L9_9HYPH|nr:ABC transporter substrate-binding protein [Enterovirga sp. DB1703]NNM71601.1 ABC transporter substrate-binding protein [Enterovirga sp. DB1703]